MLFQRVLVVEPRLALVTVVSNAIVFCQFVSFQVALFTEFRITLVTVVLDTLMLRHLMSPQVAHVAERGLAKVTVVPGWSFVDISLVMVGMFMNDHDNATL